MKGIVSAGAPGQERLGRKGDNLNPLQVDIDCEQIVSCGVGWRHNIVVYENGKAYGWGYNDENQLGNLSREVPRPKFMETFKDFRITWVHCGDKITVVLTDSGDVYAIGSTYGASPVRLQSSKPLIFCTCGVGTVYALDCNGDIFACTSASGKGVVYHLPEPICDIAAGSTFCLAVSISGTAYAKGNDAACGCGSTQPSDSFMPISSLIGIKISRVVAYSTHSIAIARDGRVFVCGTTSEGRIGIDPTTFPLSTFTQITDLEGENIIDADCGDAHSLFLTKDGHVYGTGVSQDGRTLAGVSESFRKPVKSKLENVTYVRCGCFHSLAFINMRRPVHPGLLFFGLLVGSIRRPKLVNIMPGEKADISISSISSYGFLTGDTVRANGRGIGTVIGVVNDKICVRIGRELETFKRGMLTFETRGKDELQPYTTVSGKELLVDTNKELCSVFGLLPGDIVKNALFGEGCVAGYANGTIWFFFDGKKQIMRVKESGLQNMFRAITLVSSSRPFKNIKCSDGVTYPIQKTQPQDVQTPEGNFAEVIGEIGALFCVRDQRTGTVHLFKKSECTSVRTNGQFTQYDIVRSKDGRAIVKNVFANSVLTLTEQSVLHSEQAKLVSEPLELVARAVGRGTRRFTDARGELHILDVSLSSVGCSENAVFPGDVYATNGGFVEALGLEDGKVVVADEQGNVTDFQSGQLVSRCAAPCKRAFDVKSNGKLELSIYTMDFRGLLYFPGDEISIDDDAYVVLGTRDGYLWVKNIEDHSLKCVQPRSISDKSKLLSRPTKNTELFIE